MQMLVSKSGRSKKVAVKTLLAAACGVGLMLSSAVDYAQAQKGGGFKAPTTGTGKAPPNKVVRDHRKPGCTGSGGSCVTPGSSGKPTPVTRRCNSRAWGGVPGRVCRDHR